MAAKTTLTKTEAQELANRLYDSSRRLARLSNFLRDHGGYGNEVENLWYMSREDYWTATAVTDFLEV